MKHDAVSLIALLVLSAFAVERVTTGVLFLLSFWEHWRSSFPNPATVADPTKRDAAERRNKLVYFVLAGAMVLVVVCLSPEMRVLHALDLAAPQILDIGLTWLVLVAGSDRIGELVQDKSADAVNRESKPIKIEGQVTLLDGR